MQRLLIPFKTLNLWQVRALIIVQALIALGAWFMVGGLFPTPLDIARAFHGLIGKGLWFNLWVSAKTLVISLGLATGFATAIAAISTGWIFRPFAAFASGMRFLGFAGLTFLFALMTDGAFELKIWLLTFGITVFMVTGLLSETRAITQDELDYAATLGITGWHAVWELFIVGRLHIILDYMRQNAAVGWTLLAMVEGITRSEGGIGAMLLVENKYLNLATVFAIQLVILLYGMGQDVALGYLRYYVCPYVARRKD